MGDITNCGGYHFVMRLIAIVILAFIVCRCLFIFIFDAMKDTLPAQLYRVFGTLFHRQSRFAGMDGQHKDGYFSHPRQNVRCRKGTDKGSLPPGHANG